MLKWFENIHQKPLGHKRLVAFGLALLFTGLLFVVWLSVWLPDFFQTSDVVARNNTQFESPKDTFVDNLASAWDGLTGTYGELKNVVSSGGASTITATSSSATAVTDVVSTTTPVAPAPALGPVVQP